MKKIPELIILGFLIAGVLTGCQSVPPETSFHAPLELISQITPTDHIVVTNLLGEVDLRQLDLSKRFSMTITGPEMNKVVKAICALREPEHQETNATLYEWELQFYQGPKLLGTADLSRDSILCDGSEYDATWTIKRLYHHIAKESDD